jgi:hypothetical protein
MRASAKKPEPGGSATLLHGEAPKSVIIPMRNFALSADSSEQIRLPRDAAGRCCCGDWAQEPSQRRKTPIALLAKLKRSAMT